MVHFSLSKTVKSKSPVLILCVQQTQYHSSYSQGIQQYFLMMIVRGLLTILTMAGQKYSYFKKCYNEYITGLNCAEGKPTLGLYYESLDPYSRKFIREEVWPVFQQMGDSFDIKFVAYGNAEVRIITRSFYKDVKLFNSDFWLPGVRVQYQLSAWGERVHG